jgi:hypothetical protein
MNPAAVDAAVASLLRFKDKVDTAKTGEPAFVTVATTRSAALQCLARVLDELYGVQLGRLRPAQQTRVQGADDASGPQAEQRARAQCETDPDERRGRRPARAVPCWIAKRYTRSPADLPTSGITFDTSLSRRTDPATVRGRIGHNSRSWRRTSQPRTSRSQMSASEALT